MKKQKKKRSKPFRARKDHTPSESKTYILDTTDVNQIIESKRKMDAHLKFEWNFYSSLARQRNLIHEELKAALITSSIKNFKFSGWQRAVKFKYGLHPLGTKGSVTFIGQRFNIGADVNSSIQSFPALYVAKDKGTALQETLGQQSNGNKKLSPIELALTNTQSEVIVSVSGQLDEVIDLRNHKNLIAFVECIKNFKLEESLRQDAKKLGRPPLIMVKTTKELSANLLRPQWRVHPLLDVPGNSQIFGQIAYQAGIQGIVYPSKFTGKDCVAIFIHNFKESTSYIKIDDETPSDNVVKRIDSSNWRVADLNYEELPVGRG